MTMADLGPERPGPASETRQLTEQPVHQGYFSGRTFWVSLAVIVLGLVGLALLLR